MIKAMFKAAGFESESRLPIWHHLVEANKKVRPVSSKVYLDMSSTDELAFIGKDQPSRALILPEFLTAKPRSHVQKRFLKIVRFESANLDNIRQLFVSNNNNNHSSVYSSLAIGRLIDQACKQLGQLQEWFYKFDWSKRFHVKLDDLLIV